jgi:hypothetical protein
MHLISNSSLLEAHLCEQEVVDYSHPLVQETIRQLRTTADCLHLCQYFLPGH